MHLIRASVLLGLVLGSACRQFEIPQVKNIIAEILDKLDPYVHYDANNHTKTVAILPSAENSFIIPRQSTPYWYEQIAHHGISAFGPSGYVVYRNVKDYGAVGNGIADDTVAINAAISACGRCGQGCSSSTTTPAVVYFPAGTYLISSSIQDLYHTQLIGNPNNMPIIRATSTFSGFGLIDGDHYDTSNLRWGSTNVFYRQVRNFVFDMTQIPCGNQATGIHWPTAQATSLQNVVFNMCSASGTQHTGFFCESGSAGFISDVTFNGGLGGLSVGNQQFTMRNLVFNGCVTAISQLWDWGWVYQGISINNCQKGIDISAGGSSGQHVGSVTLIDSFITNTPIGLVTAYTPSSSPATAGTVILENVALNNVPVAIQENGGTILAGTSGSMTIAAWGEGLFTPNSRPASLLSGGKYYTQSKPQYNTLPLSSFQSVRSCGAQGNGVTDDTNALQQCINTYTASVKVIFFDAGTYRVTSTLKIPLGARLVGESYSVIMSSGSFFNNINAPRPVVQVGTTGQSGVVQWSDMIVSIQGTQAGAVLIQWNLASPAGTPSGMWDVHVRVGGFTGSNLQISQCPSTPATTTVNIACIGAYMSLWITSQASGLYMENVWIWTADHDIDDPGNRQLTVYNGRGLNIESTAGTFWLVGTAVEHHTLYQYQLANTKNVYMGFIQTETPYYQPNPSAPTPFSIVTSLHDPPFPTSCSRQSGFNAWGLRILSSSNVLIYGAGLYSFFDNYNTTCSNNPGPENCQDNILSLEGSLSNVNVYCLSTVGTTNMITKNGASIALYSPNVNVYPNMIARFSL